MNLSNRITLSRLFIMPIFICSLGIGGIYFDILAFLCFIYASYSDWLDGNIARKYNFVTDFGKFMDPLIDKIFVSSAFISFVGVKELDIPSWMVIVILSREFLVTGFRTIAASKNIVIQANTSGKFKTVMQLIAIGSIILVLIARDFNKVPHNFEPYLFYLPKLLILVVVFFTVVSGIIFFCDNKKLILE